MSLAPPQWYPRRGEVYLAELDKERPAIIISSDALNGFSFDVCVVPMTRVRRSTFSVRPLVPAGEAGLRTDSWAKCDQVTIIERSDLRYPAIGTVSATTMARIEEQVRTALELD